MRHNEAKGAKALFSFSGVEQDRFGRSSSRSAARRKRVLCALSLLILLCSFTLALSSPANALDFEVLPLEQLAEESDVIIVGHVLRQTVKGEVNGEYDRYDVKVDKVLKGSVEEEDTLQVESLRYGDEGVLYNGHRYVLLLDEHRSLHRISGVHSGIIETDGIFFISRFYNNVEIRQWLPDEIEQFIAEAPAVVFDENKINWPERILRIAVWLAVATVVVAVLIYFSRKWVK